MVLMAVVRLALLSIVLLLSTQLLPTQVLAQPLVSMPLECGDSATITQGVGGSVSHYGGQYYAWDISQSGTSFPVAAAADGVVAAIYNRDGAACTCCGSCTTACRTSVRAVMLRHDGYFTAYYHLSSIRVNLGDRVDRGERLGMSGQTGHSCGIHLHFQAQTTASLLGAVARSALPRGGRRAAARRPLLQQRQLLRGS